MSSEGPLVGKGASEEEQGLWEQFKHKFHTHWLNKDVWGLLTLLKPAFSLVLHFVDWGSDLLLLRQLLLSQNYWWAGISASFIVIAGVGSSVMAIIAGLSGPVLLLYMLGFGPAVELMITPKILAGDYSSRWVMVKAAEPLLESVPSVGFQVYLIIYRGFSETTKLQWVSVALSLVMAGYGMMAMLRELPVFRENIVPVARSCIGMLIAVLVPLDLLLHMVPMSLFMREAAFRPWSLLAAPPALWLFEMLLLTFFEHQHGSFFAYWEGGLMYTLPFIAFAACFTIAARVLVLWVHEDDASFRTRPVWISHLGQLLARLGMAALVVPPTAHPWLWVGLGILAVAVSALVGAMIQAKGATYEDVCSEQDKTQEPEMTCLCW